MKKKFHLVYYVADSTAYLKKFKTIKALNEFVLEFQSQHLDPMDGYWIDFAVTNVTGDILHYEENIEA
jgi:hypothetical protein